MLFKRLYATNRMNELPQGGTAIGTGINTHKDFSKTFCSELNKLSKFKTKPSKNFYQGLSSVDNAVELSSAIKNLSIILMKISNDHRCMMFGQGTLLSALTPKSSSMLTEIPMTVHNRFSSPLSSQINK